MHVRVYIHWHLQIILSFQLTKMSVRFKQLQPISTLTQISRAADIC